MCKLFVTFIRAYQFFLQISVDSNIKGAVCDIQSTSVIQSLGQDCQHVTRC